MESDPYLKIIKDHPKLFKHCKCIECGPGWAKLISELSDQLEREIDKNDLWVFATQVKEKFGMLRVYMSSETPEISNLIEEAELASEYICEMCGKPGSRMKINGWLSTACDEHR